MPTCEKRKRSADKATVPGPKQVFRGYSDGTMSGDVIGGTDEDLDGEPLLTAAMRGGDVVLAESLEQIRERSGTQLAALPRRLRRPAPDDAGEPYTVRYSERLLAAIAGP